MTADRSPFETLSGILQGADFHMGAKSAVVSLADLNRMYDDWKALIASHRALEEQLIRLRAQGSEILVNCAQILDVVKGEWGAEWSEWDQSVRDSITSWHIDAEVSRVLGLSDDQIMAEYRAAGYDPDACVAEVRKISDGAIAEARATSAEAARDRAEFLLAVMAEFAASNWSDVQELQGHVFLNEGELKSAEASLAVAKGALEIISGERQCVDNLMSNADIARQALEEIRGSSGAESAAPLASEQAGQQLGVSGDVRNIEQLWARDLTDDELTSERARIEALWDDMVNDPEFEGGGGSPGEWMVERLDEIATEQNRRASSAEGEG